MPTARLPLGICESLILALTDSRILSEKDARDLLADVASTHQAALENVRSPGKNITPVIAILERIPRRQEWYPALAVKKARLVPRQCQSFSVRLGHRICRRVKGSSREPYAENHGH